MTFKVRFTLLILLFIYIVTELSCSTQKKIEKKITMLNQMDNVESLILQIDFRKDFIYDTVGLKLNGYSIFDSIILTTNDIIDFTQFKIYIYSIGNGKIAVSYMGKDDQGADFSGKIKILKTNLSSILLTISVNKNEDKFSIDFSKGKYIGFSKTTNAGLKLVQMDRKFLYD